MHTGTPPIVASAPRLLWVTFWIKGVLLSHLLFGAILFLFRHIDALELALLIALFLVYTASILRSIWRDPLEVGNRYWLQLARALTFAWALNALFVSVFLLLGRIDTVTVPF